MYIHNMQLTIYLFRWMDERCFRPLLCTVKAELGRGQPGLMRWIWDETLPQSSIDRSTFYSAAHRATKWASGHPPYLFRMRFCEAQMVSVAAPFTLWSFFHLCSNLNLSWLTQIHITYTIKCLKTYCLYIFVDIICEKFKKRSSKLKCCFLREKFLRV